MSHKTLCGATQGKFWGKTSCFYVSETSEVHYIDAIKGGYCSRHHHEKKWNRFVVLEGKLKVVLYKDGGEDETILTDGMFSDVPPMVDHRFEVLEDTKALEVYWVDSLDPTDIVRKDTGGKNG